MITDYKNEDMPMRRYSGAWLAAGMAKLQEIDPEGRALKVGCIGHVPFDMGCKVLCGAYWPTQTAARNVPPPAALLAAINHHRSAYDTAHKDNRKLEYSMQDGEIEFMFRPSASSKPYSITTSTLQGAAILLVQEAEAKGARTSIG